MHGLILKKVKKEKDSSFRFHHKFFLCVCKHTQTQGEKCVQQDIAVQSYLRFIDLLHNVRNAIIKRGMLEIHYTENS